MKFGPPVQIFTIFKTILNSLWSGKNSSVLKCLPTTTYKSIFLGTTTTFWYVLSIIGFECLSDAEDTKWWNPGKLHQIKHPAKCARKNKKRGLKSQPKKTKSPKWVIKGQRNKLCSKAPTIHLKHIRKRKGWEVLTPYIPATPPRHLSLPLLAP